MIDQSVFNFRPKEYKWFTIDKSGLGSFHYVKPKIYSCSWLSDLEAIDVGVFEIPGIDWTKTLIERAQ